jgi:site-specific DNA recombinase
MIAAIYARKSTEQNGVGDEEKSVTRQVEHARAYAAKKGWVVHEDRVYVDDGISGAEFVKRPGFLRLMNALKPRPPFQFLIMSEESRLGREQIETAYALKQIIDSGVRVFFYLEGRERTLDSPIDKMMLSLTGFASEMEREKARQRTYDAMVRKAKALHVTGGRVFGYENEEVLSTEGKRLHVLRKVNAEQARIVQRIFELYAKGSGLTRIAKTLNAEHVAPPREDGRGWAPTAIREILHRELYRGVVVWNRTQKIMRRGSRAQRKRPLDQWLRLDAPELRIVSDELWNAVYERLKTAAESFPRTREGGRLIGRPSLLDGASPYLLTGFTECSLCQGAVGGVTQFHGNGPASNRKRITFYACNLHRKRGPSICANDVVLRQEIVDQVVLEAIRDALDQKIIDASIDKALARLDAGQKPRIDRRFQIEQELSLLEARLARLVQAIASGGPIEALIGQLKAEEARKKALADELAGLRGFGKVIDLDAVRIKRDLRGRVADVVALLGRHTFQARQMLRRLLAGKIRMEPIRNEAQKGYRLFGRLNIGRLLQAEVLQALQAGNSLTVVAPTGFEPVFGHGCVFAILFASFRAA